VCGADARKLRLNHADTTGAVRETWIYDVAADTWTPLDASLSLPGYDWLTAAPSGEPGVVLMVAFGRERQTLAFRYDATAPAADLPGAAPGDVAWKYPEQKGSLESAPPADRAAAAAALASLPANRFVDASPPGLVIAKTWSTAAIDTDRGEVLYLGGGHSGYSGNDVARYSIDDNRWGLDFPPRFPPMLESTNAGIYGWSYGFMPFSQHTYRWYAYDPASKTLVYLARPSLADGATVQLTDDPAAAFIYNQKEHGCATWAYDSARRKMHRPCFGRPFANPWSLAVVGTPGGVYAVAGEGLYHGRVSAADGTVRWERLPGDVPRDPQGVRYHYEFQPLMHDSRRERLVLLKGTADRVDVYVRPLAPEGRWERAAAAGQAAIGREAVYIARHDTVLWLADKRLFALDCAAGRMGEVRTPMPQGLYGHECAMVYDPSRDVCVALIPSRFSGPLQTMLLRYDPRGPGGLREGE
jgi:hypothetical protein